jgi:hypothetical protein
MANVLARPRPQATKPHNNQARLAGPCASSPLVRQQHRHLPLSGRQLHIGERLNGGNPLHPLVIISKPAVWSRQTSVCSFRNHANSGRCVANQRTYLTLPRFLSLPILPFPFSQPTKPSPALTRPPLQQPPTSPSNHELKHPTDPNFSFLSIHSQPKCLPTSPSRRSP